MLRWIPYAMVRITLFFVGGILFGVFYPESLQFQTALVLFLVLVAGYFIGFFIFKNRSVIIPFSGITGLMAMTLAGYLNLINHNDKLKSNHFANLSDPIERYYCRVTDAPEERVNSRKVGIEMIAVKVRTRWQNVTGKSLLYVSKKSGSDELTYGDEILVQGTPEEIALPGNPGEFNLKQFLSFRNIFHQHFVHRHEIIKVRNATHRSVAFYSQLARTWASSKIEEFVLGDRERAITKALILGVTDGLDDELLGAYAASGAMHILSVSGLHVGIIYGIILLLLKPVSGQSWSRWLIAILTLLSLWAYAFVTGLSPSVLRAVTMFSFLAVATPFGRQTNIYNTLAASAFLLLIYDPYLIMSVGFQLSYLAVIGIVYLQRSLYNLWEPSLWLLDKIWQALCVSLAAQLATFAPGLYYFQQFPVYFLIANLVVIPLSSLVLVMGIALLAISFIPLWAAFFGRVLQFLIDLLNASVFLVEDLPGSLLEDVHLTAFECGLILVIVVSIVLLIEQRKFQFVVTAFLFVLLFGTLRWKLFFDKTNQSQLIVYSIPGHGAVEWIEKGESHFYADSGLVNNEQQIRLHIRPNRIASGIRKIYVNTPDSMRMKSYHGFRYFHQCHVTLFWINTKNCDLPKNAASDYVIIGNDAVRSLESLKNKIKFRFMILDSSNSPFYASRIVREARIGNIQIHEVSNQGAFVVTL